MGKTVRLFFVIAVLPAMLCLSSIQGLAQTDSETSSYGPFNGTFLADGLGLSKPIGEHDGVLRRSSAWSIDCWVRSSEDLHGTSLVAGIGEPAEVSPRYLGLQDGHPFFWSGASNLLSSPGVLDSRQWHLLAVTYDGAEARLYSDGLEVAHGRLPVGPASSTLQIAPAKSPWPQAIHFAGQVGLLRIFERVLPPDEISSSFKESALLDTLNFEEGSKPWPVQTHGQAGLSAPQDPATLPRSAAPYSRPVALPLAIDSDPLKADGQNGWTLKNGWKLAEASSVTVSGREVTGIHFDSKNWLQATVPGTVLTTLIDRGVFPDPDYGLDNLAIPERLGRQSFWYRNQFTAPRSISGRSSTLTFKGINYQAEIWLNGVKLGEITGAFIRGSFNVTRVVKPGEVNVVAVRISPPPHGGIAHEQSIMGGAGDNGGMMALDGPTFAATEGWDWIPGIRDRNAGIWQDVMLTATGEVEIGDPQVITTLPLPDTSRADLVVNVPLSNSTNAAVHGTLQVAFDQVLLKKTVVVPPGGTVVTLKPTEFSQLTVQRPRLWWPNGYGKPELYQMKLTFDIAGRPPGSSVGSVSDSREVRFGIREITYELGLFDSTGHVRRVEISPSAAVLMAERLVDQSHMGLRETPDGWVASLAHGAELLPAVKTVRDHAMGSDLVIKVNGVRIACKGGNWGMDDSRKRVSRERLEPYFRLHRDANLNMIRNWMGQNTEEAFYDLADEYGLLIWNDFWDSTQNYNLEPDNSALFLANARDTILRFRNHPSIAIWCGRNEGVPPPAINDGLADLVGELDGTRYYSASSNTVNLRGSGPYKYQEPEKYFTDIGRGFSVEMGIPSLPTLEALRSFLPAADQWPISDAWAYHDWHQSGNGDVAPFMETLVEEFGAPANLEDFELKAQMLNYSEHRAVFEGFNAHLWEPNSGRLLWMTQPAWPSTMWQILSHDYDTQASFYGVKKACEPVHVQMSLPNYGVEVVNNTETPLSGLTLQARVLNISNKMLFQQEAKIDAGINKTTSGFTLNLTPAFASSGVLFVKLELKDVNGKLLSENFYWQAENKLDYRQLGHLPAPEIHATATKSRSAGETKVKLQLSNSDKTFALEQKLILQNADDSTRILPAYFSDNYVSLMPGETRTIEISFPSSAAHGRPKLALRGWNTPTMLISIPD